MLGFIVGAVLIVLPPEKQIPLAVVTAIVKGVSHQVLKRRQKRNATREIHERNQSENGDFDAGNEVTLEWSDVTCTLKSKDGSSSRVLLDDLKGVARPGRMLAIIGPSGSGKTTMLNVLAGQLPYNRNIRLEGYVTANKHAVPAPGVRSGFVAQEDLFFSQLTVRETLLMTAEMRATKKTSREEISVVVEDVIRRLGLSKSADTPIGDSKMRGLSGGEKKRLSIACELVARPQLIFADEPTSGLDAFAAQQAMEGLKDLTKDGHTVIASIHQPRSSIYAMIDDLCLLSEGKMIYFGDAEEALKYFAELGYPCPEHYNPAEHLADLVAIDHSSVEREAETKERVNFLAKSWRQSISKESENESGVIYPESKYKAVSSFHRPSCSLGRQVRLLLRRSWRQVVRDKATIASRASSQLSSALVFSSIYWRLGKSQAAIQSRIGLIQVSAVGTAMSSLIKTLNVFPNERTIVTRERARASYPVLPYLLSKLAAELPIGAVFPAIFGAAVYPATGLNPKLSRFMHFLGILTAESFSAQALGLAVGAAAPSTEAALAIGPAVILVSIVFGGLFVNEKSVPKPLQWVPKTSLIKHAFEAGCINEFEDQVFDDETLVSRGESRGRDILARLGFENDSIKNATINQGRIMLFYWWCCYSILKAKKPKYQPLLPVSKK